MRKQIKNIDFTSEEYIANMLNKLEWKILPGRYNQFTRIDALPLFWQRWLHSDVTYFRLEGMVYKIEGSDLQRINPKLQALKIKPKPRWKAIEIK